MTFRADEAARLGYETAIEYLINESSYEDEAQKSAAKNVLTDLIAELGPVVGGYPVWHPLISNQEGRFYETVPSARNGYDGLDHTIYFVSGFISCPYNDGKEILKSVEALPYHPGAIITAERLDVRFYNSKTTSILVKCEWVKPLEDDGTIPLSVAMPLLLEKEIPHWRTSEVAETWETMGAYFLGWPHGGRSSLFVNQDTVKAMKRIWNEIINTGMYGPIYKKRSA